MAIKKNLALLVIIGFQLDSKQMNIFVIYFINVFRLETNCCRFLWKLVILLISSNNVKKLALKYKSFFGL